MKVFAIVSKSRSMGTERALVSFNTFGEAQSYLHEMYNHGRSKVYADRIENDICTFFIKEMEI